MAFNYNRCMAKISIFLKYWGPALLMMAVIFGFSSIPSTEMPNFGWVDYIVKKGGHALGYALLAFAYLHALKGDVKDIGSQWLFTAWAMAVLFSTTDEFHQSFVPGRHPAATDVLIDSLGAAVAMILASWYDKQKRPAPSTDP